MGNTCKPMADSFQCMTKSTTIKKKMHFWCSYKSAKVRWSQGNKCSGTLPENLKTLWGTESCFTGFMDLLAFESQKAG